MASWIIDKWTTFFIYVFKCNPYAAHIAFRSSVEVGGVGMIMLLCANRKV
jgi:hypothetical protein